MKQSKWNILSNVCIAEKVWKMVLRGDTTAMQPGQFVEIAVPGYYLRRPISVCDIQDDCLTIIYKTVGHGTDLMARMQPGETLDILSCLGHGYDLRKAGDEVLVVGGGVGVPPLIYLAKQLRAQGKHVHAVLGFNTEKEVFAEEMFASLGCKVEVCTMDGSYGRRGVVTDLIAKPAPFYYACGPLPMLRAIAETVGTNGQMSMEERMGCGVGICVGCSIETKKGVRRVCKEGPVFDAEELIW
ncbi:MAG: dihydroorotate dehydrogenase electron transfer subunit [Paludibacteraceae bacterium]|nr:dihydroorotate dehydrogenase electron transfer subunit [Paludibacteraceae bacterium]